MRKKPKERTVVANCYMVLLCQKRSEERINWRKESRIRDQIRRDERLSSLYHEESKFEDRLHRERGLFETVKFDSGTNKPHLYSFEVWYEYKLHVKYTYAGQSFEAQVAYEPDIGRLPDDCKLYITFRDDEPQRVLAVSEHRDSLSEHLRGHIQQLLRRK